VCPRAQRAAWLPATPLRWCAPRRRRRPGARRRWGRGQGRRACTAVGGRVPLRGRSPGRCLLRTPSAPARWRRAGSTRTRRCSTGSAARRRPWAHPRSGSTRLDRARTSRCVDHWRKPHHVCLPKVLDVKPSDPTVRVCFSSVLQSISMAQRCHSLCASLRRHNRPRVTRPRPWRQVFLPAGPLATNHSVRLVVEAMDGLGAKATATASVRAGAPAASPAQKWRCRMFKESGKMWTNGRTTQQCDRTHAYL
jgi:hypothetical protein